MNVTQEEAAQALADINRASERVAKRIGYNHGAPYFILWGLIWLVANTVTHFRPDLSGLAWGIGVTTGMLVSTGMGVMQSRNAKAEPGSRFDPRMGRRIGFTCVILLAFMACLTWLANPQSSREVNVIISIFFPFIYMAAGVWAGWRLFAIGLVTAIAILVGYAFVQAYFGLWMGVFAGGSLIAGGVWLRTA